jgi:hypothetical protein
VEEAVLEVRQVEEAVVLEVIAQDLRQLYQALVIQLQLGLAAQAAQLTPLVLLVKIQFLH